MSLPIGLLIAFVALEQESHVTVLFWFLLIIASGSTFLHLMIQKHNRGAVMDVSFQYRYNYVPPTREELEVAGRKAMESFRLGEERTLHRVTRRSIYNANQKMIDEEKCRNGSTF